MLPNHFYEMKNSVQYLTLNCIGSEFLVSLWMEYGKPVSRNTESTWNDTFNKGSHRSAAVFAIGFIPGLIKAFLFELYLILSGKLDR